MPTQTPPVILVVDDDPSVLEVLGAMLGWLGYTPLLVSDGAKGVELLRANPGSIAAALLDVLMPGMDGPATMDSLHALEPNLPCVFISGETGLYTMSALTARGGFKVLRKPVKLEDLRESFVLAATETDEVYARKLFFSADALPVAN